MSSKIDVLVVGAGLSGATFARLAADCGRHVTVFEARNSVGGFCSDSRRYGVMTHDHGPHIFHTDDYGIWSYVSRFCRWNYYKSQVLSFVGGEYYPMPVNRDTLSMIYGQTYSTDDMRDIMSDAQASNAAEAVIGKIGRQAYETLFAGYTKKQWGMPAEELDADIMARLPVYTSNHRDYNQRVQYSGVPRDGYTAMITAMLDHPNITVQLDTDYIKHKVPAELVVYTGPLDRLFGSCYGKLPYRGIRCSFEARQYPYHQRVGTIVYPSPDVPYTRICEYKHLTGEIAENTVIGVEYPVMPLTWKEEAYPVSSKISEDLATRYKKNASDMGIQLLGRLANFKYLDMDMVVSAAMDLGEEVL